MGAYPTLAGQHADYLERALVEYQKGDRKNAIMQSFAAQLSAADIKAIADYYDAQQPALKTEMRHNWL
jgi:cytochrome c553